MKNAHTLKITIFSLAILFVSGCAMVPSEIDLGYEDKLVKFESVANTQELNPDVQGQKARWGGKIVSVENKKDVSEIEIVFFPENRYGRPRLSEESAGRFKAVVEGFVDPIVFEQGRIITVVGEIGSKQVGIIGEQEYAYATLNAKGYHLWKETTNVEVDTFSFSPFGFGVGYHRNFFHPWYDPWHRRYQRVSLRYKKYNGHSQGATVDNRRNRSSHSSSSSSSSTRSNTVTYSTSDINDPVVDKQR